MEEVVTLQLEAPLALVTLNRPKSLNALNSEVYRQLVAILRRVEGMDTIKAVILTGAGDKAFAAGADIAQMVHEDSMAARRLSGLCHEAAGLLENMRQVTIAAVNGYALGGGCELTLACDIRIAAEQARFALPEVTLGIIPGGGGTQRLARLIGAGRAKEMIFTGDQIDAQEAWRIGLVNHVVPKEDLLETCRTLGKKIASRASYAVYLAKTAINSSQEIDLKNPKTNRKNAGFTDEEREKFTRLLDAGFIDTWRYFNPDLEGVYSWWSYRFSARQKNAGWRIDYFCVSDSLKDRLVSAAIHTDVMGSDHCPVEVVIGD